MQGDGITYVGEEDAEDAGASALARSYADAAGLDIDWSAPDAASSELAVIAQTPEAFDYPGIIWPAAFHYAGPFLDGGGREPVPFPWDELDGRPLIYASQGTVVNGQEVIHIAGPPARTTTASSPSTWPWPAGRSTACSTANSSCPRPRAATATGAAPQGFRRPWSTGPSGGSRWSSMTPPGPMA